MVLFIFLLSLFGSICSFSDPMQVEKAPRRVKFNLYIDVIAIKNATQEPMDLDTFSIPHPQLRIQIAEPDEDFIMLDREDFPH